MPHRNPFSLHSERALVNTWNGCYIAAAMEICNILWLADWPVLTGVFALLGALVYAVAALAGR